jgi:hypothetical protein
MKRNFMCLLAAAFAGIFLLGLSASAQIAVPSTFKQITIDGSFSDWTGVPLAYNAADGPTNAIQYDNIYIANDETNLYIRATLYAPRANAFANSFDNIFIDTDDSVGTGFVVGGIGSEMLIQWGGGYQEKNGGFNEGVINNLGYQLAGSADGLDFEVAISLGATYPDGTSVFSTNAIAILLEGDDTGYNNAEFAPPSGGLVYAFAAAPGALSSDLDLVDLSATSWQANDAGSDLGTNWLGQTYDDTQAGWESGNGLFGYTTTPGSYPTIATPLATGAQTYYFRTHFQWTNDPRNVAFVVSNYLSDGAVYYVNGAEVKRERMPSGAVSYATLATGTNSPVGAVDIFGFDGGVLQSGDNIVEVETHQAASSAADMVFGMSLTAATHYPVYIVETNLPADQTALAGTSVTFTSDVIGSGPLSYQWYFGTNAIAGATSATYTIPSVLAANAGSYSLVVSNAQGHATSRTATLTVNNIAPGIVTEPVNVVAVQGQPAALTVVASGTPLLLYQWYLNSAAIMDATNASYTLTASALSNSGSYYVSVSNPAGTTNSSAATLTVVRDTLPPTISTIAAGASQVVITFTKPVDPTTGANAALYQISGGAGVSTAVVNPSNPDQVILTASAPLNLGTVYTLTINGVDDLFGNALATSAQFTRGITIDGSFDDWDGLAPVYSTSAASGNTGAADFKDIYVFNDANYFYFRVTLWTDLDPSAGHFPAYVNMFFDTDNDPTTGYSAIGSEMLIQSGYSYQEKDGGFNDGVSINGLDFLCLPADVGTNFEFRLARSATFQDGTAVFTTNEFQFLFQGMTTGFVVVNTAPSDGGTLAYTNLPPVTVAPLPLGAVSFGALTGGNAVIVWNSPGTLQSSPTLSPPAWTNVPASSPYVIPATGAAQFFRLSQ